MVKNILYINVHIIRIIYCSVSLTNYIIIVMIPIIVKQLNYTDNGSTDFILCLHFHACLMSATAMGDDLLTLLEQLTFDARSLLTFVLAITITNIRDFKCAPTQTRET